MAIVTTNSAHYTAIAAAIRAKNGETAQYKPSEMAGKITAIPEGAEIDYSVITGETRPTTAAENTIWLKTTTPVTRTLFRYEQPASPTSGMVWIKPGSESHVPFSPIKDGDITLYPLTAHQYNGSQWVEISEKASYLNGAWESWNVHLYDRGKEYTDLTGSWRTYSRGASSNITGVTGTLTREAASLYVTGTSNVNTYHRYSGFTLAPVKLVTLTGINSICVETSHTVGSVTLGLRLDTETYISSSPTVSCTNASATKQTFTLDVSGVSGEREIALIVTSTGTPTTANQMALRLHRMWLE